LRITTRVHPCGTPATSASWSAAPKRPVRLPPTSRPGTRRRFSRIPLRLDQHVKAHEQPECIVAPLIVDDGVIDNNGATLRKSLIGPIEQQPLLRDVKKIASQIELPMRIAKNFILAPLDLVQASMAERDLDALPIRGPFTPLRASARYVKAAPIAPLSRLPS
jgi:hypothetical protein